MPAQEMPSGPSAPPFVVLEDTGVAYVPHPGGGQRIFYDEGAGLLHIVEGRMVTAVAIHTLRNTERTAPGAHHVLSPPLETPRLTSAGSAVSQLLSPLFAASSPPQLTLPASHRRAVSEESHVSSVESVGSASTRAFLASEGPPVTAVLSSLNGALTALQRSRTQVEIMDHATGNMFVEAPQKRDAELHGFFWTDARDAEFVMVTSHGIELFSLQSSGQGLRPTAFQRLSYVRWFSWSHSTRILVAGCGSAGAKLQPFQFTRFGVLRLPLLDLTPPWGSPMKTPASRAAPWLQVTPAQVWTLLAYRRVLIAVHDESDATSSTGGTIRVYRLYRDATALHGECALLERGPVELSVVDNVIIIHHLVTGTTSAVDPAGVRPEPDPQGRPALAMTPLCRAAPLGVAHGDLLDGEHGAAHLQGRGGAERTHRRFGEESECDPVLEGQGGLLQRGLLRLDLAGVLSGEGQAAAGGEEGEKGAEKYEEREERRGGGEAERGGKQHLALYHPELALDPSSGRLLRLRLDLMALAEGSDDVAAALSFLQRRRRAEGCAPREDPRHVTLSMLRRLIAARAPPAQLRAAFDAVTSAAAAAAAAAAADTKLLGEPAVTSAVAFLPKEIALSVLSPLLLSSTPAMSSSPLAASSSSSFAAAARFTPTVDAASVRYLQAALAELIAACHASKITLEAEVASLYLSAYCAAGQAFLVSRLLETHAPLLDSAELAARLERGAAAHAVPAEARWELALAMWRRLGDHAAACSLLLRRGRAAEAVREARRLGLPVGPEWVAAATATGDAATALQAGAAVAAAAAAAGVLPASPHVLPLSPSTVGGTPPPPTPSMQQPEKNKNNL